MAQHAKSGANATLTKETIIEAAPDVRDTVSRETSTSGARTVFGFVGVAVLFALIGNEIKTKQQTTAGPGVLTESGTIIFGGFTAAAVLTLISHAGEGGNRLAVGLAAVTMVSSVLVYGGPVWKAINGSFGQTKPTNPTSPLGAGSSITPRTGSTAGTVGSQPLYIV